MAEDACQRLVALVAQLAARELSPRRLLLALGREAAGIREGPVGLIDLALGGRDVIIGRGMKSMFDDASRGQVRHFAGVATSTALLGPGLTRRLSVVRGDSAASPDGRLSEAAIDFAVELLSRRLAVASAADWLRTTLCKDPPMWRLLNAPERPAERHGIPGRIARRFRAGRSARRGE